LRRGRSGDARASGSQARIALTHGSALTAAHPVRRPSGLVTCWAVQQQPQPQPQPQIQPATETQPFV